MKPASSSSATGCVCGPACRAFTLSELMVTMTIFGLLLAGILAANLIGARMFELTRSKLNAADDARAAVSLLMTEVRDAKIIRIGNGSLTNFVEAAVNMPQQGSAIQIHPTTNTNVFIRYFWDGAQRKLMRTYNGAGASEVIANSVSNQLVFTAEDYAGNILTNNANNRVIGLMLQFYQLQYPIVQIGPGQLYDYYQLRSKITRRALE
jgi:prepilin-type N-terminal cleavage/methylation domain-containing protein